MEQTSRPVMPVAMSTTRSSPGRERLGIAGLEGLGETPMEALGAMCSGQDARAGPLEEERGGGTPGEGRKVERM